MGRYSSARSWDAGRRLRSGRRSRRPGPASGASLALAWPVAAAACRGARAFWVDPSQGLASRRSEVFIEPMTEASPAPGPSAQEPAVPAYFSAVLTPNRALSPQGFMVLMAAICVVSFATGLMFFLMGAWPVIGFMGLDVLLIYICLLYTSD